MCTYNVKSMSSNNIPKDMSSTTTPVDTMVTFFSILTNVVKTDIFCVCILVKCVSCVVLCCFIELNCV